MLFGIVALVLVAQTWIIFGIVMGQAPKKNVDPACLIAIVSGIFALISCIIGLINGVNVPLKPFFQCAGILTIGGFVNAFQLTLMSKAMQRGPNGIIWSITQSGFIIPFIIGILFFNSEAGIIRYSGFVLTIISLFLIGITQKTEKKEYSNWLLLTFGAFVITGISQTLSNIPSYFNQYNEISSVWRSCFSLVGMTLGALFSPFTDGSYKNYGSLLKENLLKKQTWIYCPCLVGFDIVGNYFLLYPGMDSLAKAGAGAISYPIMVGACIIGFEIYSIVILREKRTLIQFVALLLCLLGVASLAFK